MTAPPTAIDAALDPKKDASRKPLTLTVLPDNIPAELRALRQWVRWRWQWESSRNTWTKVPVRPASKALAATNRPRTWGSFDEALRNLGRHDVDGIGFVFSADDPFCGIDVDACRDPATGELTEPAKTVIELLDGYTEFSVTGTGIHIIVRAVLPDGAGRKHGQFEIYDRLRYFVFTGAAIGGCRAD